MTTYTRSHSKSRLLMLLPALAVVVFIATSDLPHKSPHSFTCVSGQHTQSKGVCEMKPNGEVPFI